MAKPSGKKAKIVDLELNNPWRRFSSADGTVTISTPRNDMPLTNERANWLLDQAKRKILSGDE